MSYRTALPLTPLKYGPHRPNAHAHAALWCFIRSATRCNAVQPALHRRRAAPQAAEASEGPVAQARRRVRLRVAERPALAPGSQARFRPLSTNVPVRVQHAPRGLGARWRRASRCVAMASSAAARRCPCGRLHGRSTAKAEPCLTRRTTPRLVSLREATPVRL